MKKSILSSFYIIFGVLVFISEVCAQKTEGIPGVDYPNYHSIPKTSFKCSEQKYIPGFYADLETECQVFHFCFKDGEESFLCPTGTIFNQALLTCDSWDNSNCTLSPLSYNVNAGPVMERAGKRIPMLMKLRNRTQGKSKTQTPNIFEKLSTLYEANSDSLSQGHEVSNDDPSSNATNKSNEESSKDKTELQNETEPLVSNDFLSDSDNSQDVSENEDSRFDSGQDEIENIVYDNVKSSHGMDYNAYEMQHESEASEDFTDFYREFGDVYGGDVQDYSLHRLDNKDYNDLNTVEELTDDELEFSKRRSNAQQYKRYRKRPVYVVVDDKEWSTASPELSTVSIREADMMLQGDEADEADEEEEPQVTTTDPFEGLSEEQMRRLMFGPERVLPTLKPLSSEAFEHLIITELVAPVLERGVQDDEGKFVQSEGDQTYETDPEDDGDTVYVVDDLAPAANIYHPDSSLDSNYESQELDTRFNDLSGYSNEVSGDPDDRLIVIPEESDSNIIDETGSENYQSEKNAFSEMATNEQMNAGSQEGGEYDQYRYYNSYQDLPEDFEAGSPYETDESDEIPSDYYNYMPEADRIAYLNYLRNAHRDETYITQHGQPMRYVDPETGYMYYGNPYSENGEASYYETDEGRQYYSQPDSSWVQQDSPEDSQNELGVTDFPLPVDITESHLMADITESDSTDSDEVSATAEDLKFAGDFQNLLSENGNKEAVYVFDFDEDSEEQMDESEVNDTDSRSSDFKAYSELDDKEVKKQNISLDEDSKPSELSAPENIDFSSLDTFFASQDNDLKSSVPSETTLDTKRSSNSWSNLATESSLIEDGPVTLSSVLERLASMKTVKPETSNFNDMDFSSDNRFLNSMAFPESMDFGPYGYGANMAQHYGMMNPMQSNNFGQFSHRTGETDKQRVSRLSSIGQRIRSMKQGKFGVFKKLIKGQ